MTGSTRTLMEGTGLVPDQERPGSVKPQAAEEDMRSRSPKLFFISVSSRRFCGLF